MADEKASEARAEKSDVETVERVIPAPPEKIFELLVDPRRHHDIDGSGTVREAKGEGAKERMKLGSKFGMHMKMGLPYSMESEVIEFQEGRCVAWQTRPPGFARKMGGGRIWKYELEPVDDGTRVRESWDISQESVGSKWLVGLDGARKKTREAMTKTLERIEGLVTA